MPAGLSEPRRAARRIPAAAPAGGARAAHPRPCRRSVMHVASNYLFFLIISIAITTSYKLTG